MWTRDLSCASQDFSCLASSSSLDVEEGRQKLVRRVVSDLIQRPLQKKGCLFDKLLK